MRHCQPNRRKNCVKKCETGGARVPRPLARKSGTVPPAFPPRGRRRVMNRSSIVGVTVLVAGAGSAARADIDYNVTEKKAPAAHPSAAPAAAATDAPAPTISDKPGMAPPVVPGKPPAPAAPAAPAATTA